MDLINKISEAFSDRLPPSTKYLCNTNNDEGVSEHFAGTKWLDHNADCLSYHTVALTFFNPEAFCYYLPAFLIWSIKEKGTCVPDALCPPQNDPSRKSYMNWWSLLSLKQKEIIILYLRSINDDCSLRYNAAADALEKSMKVGINRVRPQ